MWETSFTSAKFLSLASLSRGTLTMTTEPPISAGKVTSNKILEKFNSNSAFLTHIFQSQDLDHGSEVP